MKTIFWTNQFKKDFIQAQSQGRDIEALKILITILAHGHKLPQHYKDHPLRGDWNRHRDCHIKSDWLLIYRLEADALVLERLGSHSELFK